MFYGIKKSKNTLLAPCTILQNLDESN